MLPWIISGVAAVGGFWLGWWGQGYFQRRGLTRYASTHFYQPTPWAGKDEIPAQRPVEQSGPYGIDSKEVADAKNRRAMKMMGYLTKKPKG